MRKLSKIILGVGLIGLGTYWGALIANQRKLVFSPQKDLESVHPDTSGNYSLKKRFLSPEDGVELETWICMPKNLPSGGSLPALLYFGGRSEDVRWLIGYAQNFHPGCVVVFANYRGYGESTGSPSEKHLVHDAAFLYDWVLNLPYVNGLAISAVGRSLGTGVATQLAKLKAIRKLVLITPYDTLENIAKLRIKFAPVSLFLKDKFKSTEVAQYVTCPTLVLLAQKDNVVPHERSFALLEHLGVTPKLVTIKGSNHLTIPHLLRTQKEISSFLQS